MKLKHIVLPFAALFITFIVNMQCYAEVEVGPFVNSGYLQLYFFPPHNEFDPNPTIPFKDRVVARYGMRFNTELSLKSYQNAFVFLKSFSLFGDSRPQLDYNYRANPIVTILSYGGGFRFTPKAEVGIEGSRHIDLGGYVLNERLLWTGIYTKFSW